MSESSTAFCVTCREAQDGFGALERELLPIGNSLQLHRVAPVLPQSIQIDGIGVLQHAHTHTNAHISVTEIEHVRKLHVHLIFETLLSEGGLCNIRKMLLATNHPFHVYPDGRNHQVVLCYLYILYIIHHIGV